MFTTLDAAAGVPNGRQKTIGDRACDFCKQKKVKCDMANPCKTCTGRGFECTFNRDRKKRGPASSRIAKSQRRQSGTSPNEIVLDMSEAVTMTLMPMSNGPSVTSPSSVQSAPTAEPMTMVCSDGRAMVEATTSASLTYWPSAASTYLSNTNSGTQEEWIPTKNSEPPSAASNLMSDFPKDLEAPEFMLPSLPIESPSDHSFNMFTAIHEQDLSPIMESVEIWPKSISQEALLPWIDVYFRRLHPTIPVLSQTMIYQEMLMRTHHHDPQFGAMLLALCAFAMTQPVQIHEVASTPSRSVQARMLLEESIKMRMTVDFGESPSVYMILASFFIFACFFGNGQHRAAHHRLREAVDLANSLAMHLPQAYDDLEADTRDQWLRTYLVLSVTERAYALQKRHTISFRGSPAVNACFMRTFGSLDSSSITRDQTDAIGMTGLLYLMETFDAIDESVVECWAGYCRYSDGHCESFDRRRALRMFRAQQRAREDCLVGSISFEPSASLPPLQQLLGSQQADISITQFWLLNRLWELCMSHGLLRDDSEHAELRLHFAYHIASRLLSVCDFLSLSSMEIYGVGLIEKVYHISMGLIKALNFSKLISIESSFADLDSLSDKPPTSGPPAKLLLRRLDEVVRDIRGGDHEYIYKIAIALNELPGYNDMINDA